jgi:hypothetical protein
VRPARKHPSKLPRELAAGSRGLPGGAEGIRTDGHRGFRPSRFVAALSTREPNLTDCRVENVLRRWGARDVTDSDDFLATVARPLPRFHL